ncbi:MAG: N-6 DNA methylase, partial [Kiritimatiellae bacterium]|nr:N-6 DNA methylase [Kiritimatiellia bacterium]
MAKSVEEPVEDWAKKSLDDHGVAHSPKNAVINHEIGEAMKKFPSKKGGKGPNFPDIQLMIEPKKGRYIPVVIEAKGRKGDLAKTDSKGNIVIENVKPDGKPDYAAISKFAINGAV